MSYYLDEDDVQSVKDSTDIVDIISEYVDLKRAGNNYKGLCPFHNEKTPSFTVSPDKNIFHCFGCGESGDAIAFIMKYNHLDFREAIEELADRANIKLRKKQTGYDRKKVDENRKYYQMNREAAIYFYRNLKKDRKAMVYLSKRGIDNNIVDRFGIGYAGESWDGLLNYLIKKGYALEDIDRAGLVSKSRNGKNTFDRFRGRIMFPIWDVKDRIIGFGGRLITEQENMPKYLNSPDSPVFIKGNNLYGLNKARDSIREKRQIILVEGYMDVIALSVHGINNAAASLGTALTPEQIKLIKRYTDNIVISYDSDNAGKQAAVKAAVLIKKEGISPKIVELDEGMDPDEYLKKYTSAEYRERVKDSKHFMDFIIGFNKEKYNLNSTEDKLQFVNVICRYLSVIESPVELDIYIDKLAQITGVSEEAVKKELESMKKRKALRDQRRGGNSYRENPQTQKSSNHQRREETAPNMPTHEETHFKAEMGLLNILLKRPKYMSVMADDFKPDRFRDSTNRKIYETLINIYKDGESDIAVNAESLSDEISDRVKKIESLELNVDDSKMEKAFEDLKIRMETDYYSVQKDRIMNEMRKLESSEAIEELGPEKSRQRLFELVTELEKLNRFINKIKT